MTLLPTLKAYYVEWPRSLGGKCHYSDVSNAEWQFPSKTSVEDLHAVINLLKMILRENYALLLQHGWASPTESSI